MIQRTTFMRNYGVHSVDFLSTTDIFLGYCNAKYVGKDISY
jgi:hypothetical protein